MSAEKYPLSQARKRPFRIWDEHNNKTLRGRSYSIIMNAHNQALVFAKWYLPVGKTITVLDPNGKVLGQYTRKVSSIFYRGPSNEVEVQKQANGWVPK